MYFILVYLFIKRLCGTSNISPNHVQVVLLCSTDIILFVNLLTCHDWLTLLWELEDVPCQASEWTRKKLDLHSTLHFVHVWQIFVHLKCCRKKLKLVRVSPLAIIHFKCKPNFLARIKVIHIWVIKIYISVIFHWS